MKNLNRSFLYKLLPSQVEVKQEEEFTLPKGSVLKLTGLGGEITREDIKEVGQLFQTDLHGLVF